VSQPPSPKPSQVPSVATARANSVPCSLPRALPIEAYLKDIQQALALQNNLVLQAEPGAGKSTVVPLNLLNAPWLIDNENTPQKIIMLEPRRVAAKSIAHFLAGQLGEKVGGRIGYHVKNDRKVGKDTQLEIVTEGILTRRLQSDPELKGVGLIIFDEFHERSLQADLGLMLALEVQQTLRDDLKLLVMSATIDTTFIAAYLNSGQARDEQDCLGGQDGAAIIQCPGRAFPVDVSYFGSPTHQPNGNKGGYKLSDHVLNALRQVFAHDDSANARNGTGDAKSGDVLIFLPGQADINRCLKSAADAFSSLTHIVFLPLFGGLSMAQQEHALQPDAQGRRRVVLTTNIAETSLTIEGVSWVIDSGLEKRIQYDPSSGMTRLDTVAISKASAEQRKGRAGRLRKGYCIRLWNASKQSSLIDYQPEEIMTAELAGLVLELYAWGQTNYRTTPWLTAPPLGHYQTAVSLLTSLGLINGNTLTELGQQAAKLSVHPRLASMLLRCQNSLEKTIACDLAALLTEQDIFSRSHNGSQSSNEHSTDIAERFLALQEYKADKKAATTRYRLKRNVVDQVLNLSISLFQSVRNKAESKAENKTENKTENKAENKGAEQRHHNLTLSDWQLSLPQCLLYAYPDRLAKQRQGTPRYVMANGKGVVLAEDDALLGSEWLIVSDCDAQKREGRIYLAAMIDKQQVLESLSEQFTQTSTYQLDAKKQKIIGREKTRYGSITVSEKVLSDIPSETFQDCVLGLLTTEGVSLLQWTSRCQQWLDRVQWLAAFNDDFPELSLETLQKTADSWLMPYLERVTSLAALKQQNIYDLLVANLTWEQQQVLEQQAPTCYTSPSDKTVDIIYDKNQGPTVSIVLQEMFGQLESPSLAYGKVPLRFELLSPARRPIQTTSDLANFWVSSYFEVAKDMRAKYPRHRWPEEPLLAEPGKSRKPYKKR